MTQQTPHWGYQLTRRHRNRIKLNQTTAEFQKILERAATEAMRGLSR
jgi:hypothetical protein